MGRLLAKPRLRAALVGLGLLCAALALIAWPAQSAAAVREGMALCANVVVDSGVEDSRCTYCAMHV